MSIKKESPEGLSDEYVNNKSHEVVNTYSSVVTVGVWLETTETSIGAFRIWVSNDAVTSLESDLRLEGVLSNCTYHLERYIWAVE